MSGANVATRDVPAPIVEGMLDALGFVGGEHRKPTAGLLEGLLPKELAVAANLAGELLELCYKLLEGDRGLEVLAAAAVDAAMGRVSEAGEVARASLAKDRTSATGKEAP